MAAISVWPSVCRESKQGVWLPEAEDCGYLAACGECEDGAFLFLKILPSDKSRLASVSSGWAGGKWLIPEPE